MKRTGHAVSECAGLDAASSRSLRRRGRQPGLSPSRRASVAAAAAPSTPSLAFRWSVRGVLGLDRAASVKVVGSGRAWCLVVVGRVRAPA